MVLLRFETKAKDRNRRVAFIDLAFQWLWWAVPFCEGVPAPLPLDSVWPFALVLLTKAGWLATDWKP